MGRPVVLFDLDGVLLSRRRPLRVLTWFLGLLVRAFRLSVRRHRERSGRRNFFKTVADWLYWEAPIFSTLLWGSMLRYPNSEMIDLVSYLRHSFQVEIVTARPPSQYWLVARLLEATGLSDVPIHFRPIWISSLDHKSEWIRKLGAIAFVDDDRRIANSLDRDLNALSSTCRIFLYGRAGRRNLRSGVTSTRGHTLDYKILATAVKGDSIDAGEGS